MIDLSSFKNNLNKDLSEVTLNIEENNGHVLIQTVPTALVKMVTHLKSKKGFSFDTLIDITAVDFPAKEQRFDVVYHFLSMTENMRCRVTTSVSDGEKMPSITSVFECANWFEREIFDLFGIIFEGHPNLKRIMMPDEWIGHPLRKEYVMDSHYYPYRPTRKEYEKWKTEL